MKLLLRLGLAAVGWFFLVSTETVAEGADVVRWIQFPDARFSVEGLPWFTRNQPELWRLPKTAKERVPAGVWNRAVAPDGGRIRFVSATSQLQLKIQVSDRSKKPCFVDAYTNGVMVGSVKLGGTNEVIVKLFETTDVANKEITIYLPNNHECRVASIGIDASATIESPKPFALKRPIVFYGSSVLQGTGAAHPSKTYPAVLSRKLNVDFVNLGFGGAGKAEREVVELVESLDASGYVFDLGKSYGDQTAQPYLRMLEAIRGAHPGAPIFCVTPIYSTKEATEAGYHEKSEKLRALMRNAAIERQKAGDKFIFVVEGPQLFGESDKELFADPLHPNDAGNERIATRLAPFISKVVLAGENDHAGK